MKLRAILIAFWVFFGFGFILLLTSTVPITSASLHRVKTKAELGRMLFFDKALSNDYSISCASCHKPEFAFADTVPFSNGINNNLTARNTPSAMNLAGHQPFFYDGRAQTLAEQALGPITNPAEMGSNLQEVINRINTNKEYLSLFKKFYGSPATPETLGDAIAAFEETLETSNTPFDRELKGLKNGMNESAKRGRKIFVGKGKCFDCHFGPDFTHDDFKNIGLYNGKELNDKGRYDFTKNPNDIGKFKVPGLRNVAITAPYMHNGMFKTLEEVIDYYNTPDKFVTNPINRDTLLNTPLNLTDKEKQDLVEFLKALTDDRFIKK